MYLCFYVYRCVTIIVKEKRGHELESECEDIGEEGGESINDVHTLLIHEILTKSFEGTYCHARII